MVLGPGDEILFANERQRDMMPLIDYVNRTYEDLFWASIAAGTIGNAAARARPKEWLEFSTFERHRARALQSINEYPWGWMAVTHRRLDDGNYIQMRFRVEPDSVDLLPEQTLLAAGRAAHENRTLRAALDAVHIGVGILDDAGQILFANAALRDTISRADVFTATGDVLILRDAVAGPAWTAAVRGAAVRGEASTLPLRRSDGMLAVMTGLTPGEHHGTAIVLTSPLRSELGSAIHDGLMAAFALTRAEAETVARMSVGQRPQEIAEARAGAVGTTYQHVAAAKRKLRKLELAPSSQADLVSMVLAVAATTRAPRRPNNERGNHDDHDS